MTDSGVTGIGESQSSGRRGVRVLKSGHRVGRRALFACLVAVAAISSLGGEGVAAAATGYHETFTQTIDAGHSLNAVSCLPATTECVAADSKGDVFYATNVSATSAATWNAWSGPGVSPSHAVECPSASLCLLAAGEVSGGGGNLYRASLFGGPFFTSFKPNNGVGAISCPSTSFCVTAQEGGGFIRYSTNPTGILWFAVSIGTGAIKDASCLSASFCAVVDDSGNVRVATTEEGIKEAAGWTATNVNSETALRGIACSSTSSCVAVDGSDEVLNLTVGPSGDATASRQGIDGADGLTAVSCTGATCAAVDDQGGAFASTNAGADWIVRHGGGAGLRSVSCASASLCAAVTTTGDVTTFNPATTTPPLSITTSSLPGGDAGAPYEAEVQATGGEPPYEWTATGLPSGLSIDSTSGEISGTPANLLCVGGPCEYPATFTVTDDNDTQASAPLTIALAVNAYALKVTTGGTGFGEVDSSPAGIDECGTSAGTCEAPYEAGSIVTLTAKPAANSTFAGWSGGGCSGTGTCQVTLSAERDVTATFSKVSPPDADETPMPPGTGEMPTPPGTDKAPPAVRANHVRAWVVRSRCAQPNGRSSPGLRNRRCAKLKIAVGGTIIKQARGVVNVKAKAYLQGRRVSAIGRARIDRGRWQARLALPWAGRSPNARIYIAARFAGSPGVRAGHAKRCVRLGRRHRRCRPASARRVVAYRQEGGIGGPRPSLVVFRDRTVRVTVRRCTTKFELPRTAWRRMRAALRGVDLHALAGDYPPPRGSADVITHVIRAGDDTVRIAPAPGQENEEVMRDLGPLLKALSQAVSAGERRMPPSCKSSR